MSSAKSQKYSVIEYLARVIWLGRYSERNLMGLLSAAYFDASGKRQGYRFLTVAGAVAPIKKWIRFEKQWNIVLSDEGVSEFHSTDFAASKREYKEWKGDKLRRSAFLKRLVKIIQENTNKLFLATIEMPTWDEVNKTYLLEETFHSPYALAGFSVTCRALNWAVRKKVRSPFKVIFEDGDEGWGGLKQLCNRYNNFEPIRLPKKEGVPFQIGDLLAWKTRIVATNCLEKTKDSADADVEAILFNELHSLDDLLVRPTQNGIYTEVTLAKTCRNFKVPKRNGITTLSRQEAP